MKVIRSILTKINQKKHKELLVAYDATAGIIKHYRVDKMQNTEILETDRKGEDHFKNRVLVSVSPQFFGWVTGIGSGMKITGPENVKQQYKEYMLDVLQNYQKIQLSGFLHIALCYILETDGESLKYSGMVMWCDGVPDEFKKATYRGGTDTGSAGLAGGNQYGYDWKN